MASLVFYMDYAPLLSRVLKSACIVYLYYDKFQNDDGVVQLTYSDLNEHLGLATLTVSKANHILKQLGLIEEVESTQGKKYKLLPIKKLSDDLRNAILTEYCDESYDPQKSSLRKKYLEDNIPVDFQQLLNKKVLKVAQKELGAAFTNGKALCKHFKIDYNTFKLLHERDGENSFKVRFKTLVKELETEATTLSQKRSSKRKEQYGPNEQALTKELYDTLSAIGARPIDTGWWLKNCAIAHGLFNKGVTLEEGKSMITWAFNDSWWKDKITDLNSLNTIYPKFKLQTIQSTSNGKSRSSLIPEDIQKEIGIDMCIENYEDAYMLKQAVLDGQALPQFVRAINILEKHGILPHDS